VTIRKIADSIEYTPPIVYEHFENKEDLFKAVIDKYLDLHIEVIHDKNISLLECIDEIVEHSRIVIHTIVSENQQFMT